VKLLGYGSNCDFHHADVALVKKNIEQAKQYVLLMEDCGGLGVKVKPNGFLADVPREKTTEQIGQALNELGAFGAAHGQRIRLEMHGKDTNEAPAIKAIFDVATHKNVYLCWNSNPTDLTGAGLEANFAMVKTRIGDTTHVRELDGGDYPYDRLFKLLAANGYQGWILLEATRAVPDKAAAMAAQLKIFQELVK
jgi:sugar phosphate isomerase/epimerase